MHVRSRDEHSVARGALLAEGALEEIKRVAADDERLQSLNLTAFSAAFQVKAEAIVSALSRALQQNNSLTMLDLSACALGDAALPTLALALEANATLFHLDVSSNAFEPAGAGLVALSGALSSNVGLIRLGL